MGIEVRFQFGPLFNVKCGHLEKRACQDLLSKWAMRDGLSIQAFHFDHPFKTYLIDEFIRDFFGSLPVVGHLKKLEGNQFTPIGIQAESIKYQKVRSTLTATEIFDRLKGHDKDDNEVDSGNENGLKYKAVVRPSGLIMKCLPEYFQPDPEFHDDGNPIEIGDQLRKLLLKDVLNFSSAGSELDDIQDVFTPEDKDEFLYRLFTHFVVGGSLCQYEDSVTPYIDMTRGVYKDLMTIGKVPTEKVLEKIPTQSKNNRSLKLKKGQDIQEEFESNSTTGNENDQKLVIKSVVVKVSSIKNENYKDGNLLFSHLHVNNFFYLIIQPEDQTVITLYHHVM